METAPARSDTETTLQGDEDSDERLGKEEV